MATCDWNYTGCNGYGPSEWAILAPDAEGCSQSPIIIYPEQVDFDRNLRDNPLQIRYDGPSVRSMQNTGHTVQIDVDGNASKLTGGPLQNDTYLLRQFHFHWGDNSCHGSEHRIDDKVYAAELHLVHWNCTQYSSFDEAVKGPNGLCVLAIFIESGDHNVALDNLCRLLPAVDCVGKTADIPDGFQPDTLLPDDVSCYWTYEGSLTTPPCFESVRFIIFKTPISASEDQLNSFRSLTGWVRGQPIVNNFRPPQSLNGRVIQSSFRKFFA